MKKEPRTTTIRKTLALLAVALVATACQSELNQPEETAPATGQKVTLTIRATQGGTDSDNTPQTRTEYTDGLTEDGSIGVKWEATETINVVGFENDATDLSGCVQTPLMNLPATLSPDGKSITFTGEVPKADKYAALYPADGWELDEEDNSLIHPSKEQIQNCTAGHEMKHLKSNDVMVAKSVAGSNSAFTFEHASTILRFDLTLTAAARVTKVTLSSSVNGIQTGSYVQPSGGSLSYGNSNSSQSISLGIKNHDGSTKLKAYLVASLDGKEAQTLTITAETDKGSYVGTLEIPQGADLEPGKCYTLKSTLALLTTLTVEGLIAGKLHETLSALTDKTIGKTKLVLSGEVSNEEFAEKNAYDTLIKSFLDEHSFTEVDLSQVKGLTEINGSFNQCFSLTNVTLPNTITTIGEKSFRSCEALTTITLPASVTTIGKECFRTCVALTTITLPASVTTIGENCFDNTGLTTITLPTSVTSIGNYAFTYCNHLQSILLEGAKEVNNGLTLGSNLIYNPVTSTIFIFLPNITDKEDAMFYQYSFTDGKVYYNYKGDYNNATPDEKVDVSNYTLYPNTPTN